MGYAVRTSHGLEEAPEGTEGALPIFKKLGPYSYYVQAGEWPTLPEPSTREDHLYKLRTRKSFKVASAYLRNLFFLVLLVIPIILAPQDRSCLAKFPPTKPFIPVIKTTLFFQNFLFVYF